MKREITKLKKKMRVECNKEKIVRSVNVPDRKRKEKKKEHRAIFFFIFKGTRRASNY